ncbi:hypothetical protein D6850_18800 [Roseovarius spongiae]|uniref:Uncharacterized protein n=1 Tax=Roseovarius spongiae TaxID=2320272 RepID=A0A3A8APS3_9RHOB|nr:hypothetical protein D6850_18800 [Roseovarius spongiae]
MSECLLDDRMIFAVIIVDHGVRFACRGGSRRMGFSALRGQVECEKRAEKQRAYQDDRFDFASFVQKMPFSF